MIGIGGHAASVVTGRFCVAGRVRSGDNFDSLSFHELCELAGVNTYDGEIIPLSQGWLDCAAYWREYLRSGPRNHTRQDITQPRTMAEAERKGVTRFPRTMREAGG
jgi:hypothetical protein